MEWTPRVEFELVTGKLLTGAIKGRDLAPGLA